MSGCSSNFQMNNNNTHFWDIEWEMSKFKVDKTDSTVVSIIYTIQLILILIWH